MVLDSKQIKLNYLKIKKRIESAQKKSEASNNVRLLAVSKKQGFEKIEFLYSCGHRAFAENYYKELEEKAFAFEKKRLKGVSWSFIGRLQSNKIRKIVSLCTEIQSLESLKHARLIAEAAKSLQKGPFPVYLLVNAGEEVSKGGVFLDKLAGFSKEVSSVEGLLIKGIMVIPPRIEQESPFSLYEKLYKQLVEKSRHVGEGEISLGMSSDLELAVSLGSNCVRVGKALFGART